MILLKLYSIHIHSPLSFPNEYYRIRKGYSTSEKIKSISSYSL